MLGIAGGCKAFIVCILHGLDGITLISNYEVDIIALCHLLCRSGGMADALRSGRSVRKDVGVQISPSAYS
jgi:hypothetical protein